jgi:hypothetical protein
MIHHDQPVRPGQNRLELRRLQGTKREEGNAPQNLIRISSRVADEPSQATVRPGGVVEQRRQNGGHGPRPDDHDGVAAVAFAGQYPV